MRIVTVTEYNNIENMPAGGQLIIAINHLSRFDIPLLFVIPARPDITALVTTKYKDYPFIRWFAESAEGIWIDRETADFAAFRSASDALSKGKAVGISPEGTRSQDGALQPGKPGVVLLALRSNAPIIPVGVWGTEEAASRFKHLQRPHMVATIGKPFTLPEMDRDNRDEFLQYWTDEIMCRIAALLPEKYRGFYAGSPRLKDLLLEQGGDVKITSTRRL
jgi:1-acyl-sn-glycerol-3-phosphate acyltransferase